MGETTTFRKIRTVRSCTLCHSRKVKCDRAQPSCGTCVRKNCAELCRYRGQDWAINSLQGSSQRQHIVQNNIITNIEVNQLEAPLAAPSPQLKQYRFREPIIPPIESNPIPIPIPVNTPEDKHLDFFSNTFDSSVCFSQGALTWVSTIRKDIFVNATSLCSRVGSVVRHGHAKEKATGNAIEQHTGFMSKWTKEYKGRDLPLIEGKKEANLLDELQKYLGNTKLTWLSVFEFFGAETYMIFPYIDKNEFIDRLSKLIGPPDVISAKPITLSLARAEELSIIGILFIILRLVSISSYNFGKELPNLTESARYVFENPTPQSIVSVIDKIHHEISAVRFPNISIFQFLSMRVMFRLFTPEEYDCLKIADAGSLGEMLDYAVHCSLHRDPEDRHGSTAEVSNPNIARRMWYMIIILDYLKFANIGYPPLVDDTFYDTKLPILDKQKQDPFEYCIDVWFHQRINYFGRLNDVLRLILNIKKKPTARQIKQAIEPITVIMENLGTIDDIMKSPNETVVDRCENLKRLMASLQARSLIFSIYYHLFNFYNKEQDVANSLIYLIEVIKVTKDLYHPILFLDSTIKSFNMKETFGPAILVFPKLELGLHKITHTFFTILGRIKYLKFLQRSKLSFEICEVLDRIVDLLNRSFLYVMTQYARASDTYYHAWLLSKIQLSILNMASKIPKGPIPDDYELSEMDKKFLNILQKNSDGVTGDLGFEKYSLSDIKKIYNELKGLEDIFEWKLRNSDKPNSSNETNNNLNKRFGNTSKKKIDLNFTSENDKKWFDRILNEYAPIENFDRTINTPFLQSNFIPNSLNVIDPVNNTVINNANEHSPSSSIHENSIGYLNDIINGNYDINDISKLMTDDFYSNLGFDGYYSTSNST